MWGWGALEEAPVTHRGRQSLLGCEAACRGWGLGGSGPDLRGGHGRALSTEGMWVNFLGPRAFCWPPAGISCFIKSHRTLV